MTIHDTLTGPVAAALAEHGITVVLSANSRTARTAWSEATEQHGERIAHIHLTDGVWTGGRPRYYSDFGADNATVLRVSYPFGDVKTGALIRDTLAAHGLNVTWDGDGANAIRINL